MAQGEVIRVQPRSEEEVRRALRQVGFSDQGIDDTVQMIREEIGNFDALEVVNVFRTPDGLWIIPEKKLEVWRPKKC
jgi:hypothetical protein